MGEGHDVALSDPRLERLENVLVDPVDHGARLGEQHDLVGALDLASLHHGLLSVGHLDAGRLQGQKYRRLGHVDAEPLAEEALGGQDVADLRGRPRRQAGRRADGALQPGVASLGVLLVEEVGELQPVGLGGGAEVPDAGLAAPGEEGEPLPLVERPVPDVGGGHIADVRGFEEEDGRQVLLLQHLADPPQAVLAKSPEVDAMLPIHSLDAGSRAGGDGKLVHGSSLPRPAGTLQTFGLSRPVATPVKQRGGLPGPGSGTGFFDTRPASAENTNDCKSGAEGSRHGPGKV